MAASIHPYCRVARRLPVDSGSHLVYWLSIALLFGSGLSTSPVRANESLPAKSASYPVIQPSCGPESCPLWLISTRQAGCGTSPENFRYEYAGLSGCFAPSSFEAFVTGADAEMPTVFFIHGNRYDAHDALQTGRQVYNKFVRYGCGNWPVRFVIFSWPSTRVSGLRQDAQVKASRSETDGRLLAELLARMQSGSQVLLIGHSYGARVATRAMSDLASLPHEPLVVVDAEDETLPLPPTGDAEEITLPQIRAVLMAAAVSNSALAPRGSHGMASQTAERVLVFYNPRDPVLKFYPRLYGRGGPEALGYTGARGVSHPLAGAVQQMNVSGMVGSAHGVAEYFNAPGIWSMVRRFAAF